MSKIAEVTMESQNDVKPIKPIRLPKLRRAFTTIFSDELRVPEIALLSEAAFTQNQHLSEEDDAWTHLQSE